MTEVLTRSTAFDVPCQLLALSPRLSATVPADLAAGPRLLLLHGDLDGNATRPLITLLRRFVNVSAEGDEIVVDLQGVVSSTPGGMAVLHFAAKLAAARRCTLRLQPGGTELPLSA